MIKIIDDWFETPSEEVEKALNTEYKDYTFSGVTWTNIGAAPDPASIAKAAEILGVPLEPAFPSFYRFYQDQDHQPVYIHSDVNEGEYTLIIFLNEVNVKNGLAFWEHESGVSSATKENVLGFFADTNDLSKWSEPVVVPAEYNRAVIFDAAQFHSRWPANGWDIGTDTARLVKVLFLKKV